MIDQDIYRQNKNRSGHKLTKQEKIRTQIDESRIDKETDR